VEVVFQLGDVVISKTFATVPPTAVDAALSADSWRAPNSSVAKPLE
jgi:hypothetical protein